MVKSGFFAPDKRVKDKQRYLLKWDTDASWWKLHTSEDDPVPQLPAKKGSRRFFDRLDTDIDPSAAQHKIAVLLESPHKDEYDKNLHPRGPARGATGKNFHAYFVSHVLPMLVAAGLKLDQDVYRIYLVNPVPYQASLRYLLKKPLKELKDAVWKALWRAGCREDFLGRLKCYRPQIVLNGCTAGVKQLVTCAVNSHGPEFGLEQHFNIAHPSSWQRALAPFCRPTFGVCDQREYS